MDVCEIIIENVKQHECLYNLASKGYKNTNRKCEIWEGIGGMTNLSGKKALKEIGKNGSDACRKRWKGLRDTYKKRKRTAQLASGSGAPSPAKKWKYMESMKFLDDYKDARATIGSVDDKENDDLPYLFDCSSSSFLYESIVTDESATQPVGNECRAKKYTKKHADAEISSAFKEVMQECANSVKEIAAGNANDCDRDSTTMLFQSLAKKMNEANLPQAVVSQIEANVINAVYDGISQNLR